MPHHAGKARNKQSQKAQILMIEAKRTDSHSQNGFQKVADKGQRPRFFAVCTQHIGAAGIAAAGGADITVVQLGRYNNTKIQAA